MRFLNFQVFQKSKKDFNISRRFLGCLRCLDGFFNAWMIFQAFDIFFHLFSEILTLSLDFLRI